MNLARRILGWSGAAALLLGCAVVLAQAPASKRAGPPHIEPARGQACVAEPAFMRRNHVSLLKHQRDETVHRGVRDPRSSLKGCVDCHASRSSGSVATVKTDFCLACHTYAAVKIDCFECHSSKPRPAAMAGTGGGKIAHAQAPAAASMARASP